MDFKAGLYDAEGDGITSSTDMKIAIKRDTDDYFYDFNDSTFKASGWTTFAATMTEPDATNIPGEYEYAVTVTSWDDGVYTIYYQYSGSEITPFTDAVEFRIYDGKEATALCEELGTQAKSDVNTQVLDVLNVDTFTEPGQGAPPVSPTIRQMMHYLYKYFRNKVTQTSTTMSVYNNAGDTVDQKSTIDHGTSTFTKGKFGSGA